MIKALHIFLAFTIYFSGIGITLNKHFCRGELKYVSLSAHQEGCSMSGCELQDAYALLSQIPKDKLRPCCLLALSEMEKEHKDCCNNESSYEQQKHELKPFAQIDLSGLIQAAAWMVPYFELLLRNVPLTGIQWNFLHYHPPHLYADLPVLQQRFLI